MWVVRDKNGELLLFNQKPVRSINYFDGEAIERWTRDIEKYPPVHFSSKTALHDPNYQIMQLDSSLFPDITWEDEPVEVLFVEKTSVKCNQLNKSMKIYLIIDCSYECDGYDSPSNIIKYVSTDKEDAIKKFNLYYKDMPESDKWHYEYQLIEFLDGFSSMDDFNNKFDVVLKSEND